MALCLANACPEAQRREGSVRLAAAVHVRPRPSPAPGAGVIGKGPHALVQGGDHVGIDEQDLALARAERRRSLRQAAFEQSHALGADRMPSTLRCRPSSARCNALTYGSTAARTKPSRSISGSRCAGLLRHGGDTRASRSSSGGGALSSGMRKRRRARARSPRLTRLANTEVGTERISATMIGVTHQK